MANLIKNLLDASRHFTAWDFTAFKICLISGGILLGSYFASFFLGYQTLMWIIFGVTWIILMVRTLSNYGRKG